MKNGKISQAKLIRMIMIRIVIVYSVFFVFFFPTAGTLDYWQAWMYMGMLLFSFTLLVFYFLKKDPGLLERRMKMREKESEQKLIIKLSWIPFVLFYLLPGFDKRFGWSNLPDAVVVAAEILVLSGYGIVFLVFRENSYASRVVEVEKGQTVITTGPYAFVRHPMYVGVILFYIFTPLALGSLWAMIPAMLIFPILVARIRNEEKVLARDLKGYTQYMEKTRYRLIPGLW